jgi:ubiquinone/menaquinone biosynthesis C-methylase UbiE
MISAASPCDAAQLKAQTREQWDLAADGWDAQRDMLRAWLGEATIRMLDAAGIRPGAHVLDVAAGTGDQTLDIAARVGSTGFVLATDLSPRSVERARANMLRAGHHHVDVQVADGESLNVEQRFDAAICRLGLMFYPSPALGVSQMFAALKANGIAATLVFSDAASNPCLVMTLTTALRHAGLSFDPDRAGGLLSLGPPGLMTERFEHAGFADVVTQRLAAPMRLTSVDDYVQFLRTSAGPMLQLMARMDERSRAAAWADMRAQLKAFETGTGWFGPNELLLTSGRRP